MSSDMSIEVGVTIKESIDIVWKIITDFENAAETISGIEQIEILETPDEGVVGLKWKETRTVFGKTATEEMWITEAVENEYYKTRAESHGCVYLSTLRVSDIADGTSLTMKHETSPTTFGAKLMSPLVGLLFARPMRKMILQDLQDIKEALEARNS